jgi:hypothetical protein
MKTNQKFAVLKVVVLGVLVAGLNAKAADLPAFQGKFTLPSATRWGQATLPAGDYSFALDHDYPGSLITVFRGTKTVARIQAVGMSDMNSGHSEMVMENGRIREVRLPQVGVTLEYFSTHHSRHGAAPQEPLAQIIPVTMASAGR